MVYLLRWTVKLYGLSRDAASRIDGLLRDAASRIASTSTIDRVKMPR
jgi:hypothetical protein